jgi:hypothetical protein
MRRYRREPRQINKKSLRQKILEAAVVIYAGFAVCVLSTFAERVTTPLVSRLRRRRKSRDEG